MITNTTHWNNVGLMLGQRRRRWTSIKPTLFQFIVFPGMITRLLYIAMAAQTHLNFAQFEALWNAVTSLGENQVM